ncbi:TonB family protein [Novosphingobium sp. Leaf2]|uniref:TonB family protein n=1 Tax=Novosphingobium sp. Leaf2 TaxID=1735670 RepID=UPI0006F30926|nr:TonB family protein [Novosphingobium sp. Leaf2]KQM22177.1 hypothetical protein ASE49_02445 [Novosphingobium sp. Leaf2]
MTLMVALGENEPGIGDATPSGPAESAPTILPGPNASERYGYRPDRKRFASAFIVTTLTHVALLFALLTWHVAVRRQPQMPPLTVTLLPLSPPAQVEPKPVQRQKAKLVAGKPPVARPMQTPLPPSPPAEISPVAPTLPAGPPIVSPATLPVAASSPDTAPSSPPVRSAGKDSWEARVVARLESLKRFPPAARSRRDQGVATVRFRVNRQGGLLSSSLEGSSGSRLLDLEALATVARAQPYPPIPAGRPDEIEVVVPIEFFLGTRRRG